MCEASVNFWLLVGLISLFFLIILIKAQISSEQLLSVLHALTSTLLLDASWWAWIMHGLNA